MAHEADEDDEFEADQPQVRPLRIIFGSLFGLAGILGAVFSWFALRGFDHAPEPQGAAAALGQEFAPVVAWVFLVVCAIIGVVATVAVVHALLEARAARRGLKSG